MSSLVKPHGSDELRPLLLEGSALDAERARAKTLPAIRTSSREAGDLVMMGIGGILYSVGVCFFLWERLRYHNAIWHAFVVVAAVVHFVAITWALETPAQAMP